MRRFQTIFNSKGLTLIELIVVITLIGIIAGVLLTFINPVARIGQANDAKVKADITRIAGAIQAYYATNQYYPADIAGLVGAGNELKSQPTPPAGVTYTVAKDPATCTTALKTCTDVAVYGRLPSTLSGTAKYYCWQSSTGKALEVADSATCTAP